MTTPQAGLSPQRRAEHLQWLLDITSIPTAAGKEDRVIAWIERWLSARPHLQLTRDTGGNLHIARTPTPGKSTPGEPNPNPPPNPAARPIYFTAHLDHPGFVVERILSPHTVELSFRGGVMDDYFTDAKVAIFSSVDTRFAATLTEKVESPMLSANGTVRPSPFAHYLADLDAGRETTTLQHGDVGTWDLPRAQLIDGIVHTPACDDLAALAAALSAYDVLMDPTRPQASDGSAPSVPPDVRLLFTRAEEIGFIGAIAACLAKTMPRDARVIALENSRAFPDSPIGGGPIVRVGDRISVFSPSLTDAIAKRAEEVAGGPATVRAAQKLTELPKWKWQRKLMAGGACEASVFCDAGYEATCVCLPLGNYHNMADLDAVQAGANTTRPTIQREFIALSDYEGLVDLLIACGERLPTTAPVRTLVEKLWSDKRFVLEK